MKVYSVEVEVRESRDVLVLAKSAAEASRIAQQSAREIFRDLDDPDYSVDVKGVVDEEELEMLDEEELVWGSGDAETIADHRRKAMGRRRS